ncbi:MAG: ATP-binding protein [Dolichospermum sp. BR01]|nr:ATP-binding protein [Dolichospermum sp. BR01]
MSQLDPFNPLENNDSSLNSIAVKKLIHNLLTSYNGWYDPFCEAIQNALDSIEARIKLEDKKYKPSIWVTIDLKNNCLMVTDNGIGLDEKTFKTFLQPNITFKDKGYRGHKGVGATYLAYSFNYVQICSKTPDFKIIARMENAKKWVDNPDEKQFPKMIIDNVPQDTNFNSIDKGVSICIKCDQETFPRDLSWLQAKDAKNWLYILCIKTGLASIRKQDNIKVCIDVIDKNGQNNTYQQQGIEYLWIHELPLQIKKTRLYDIRDKKDSLKKKDKDPNNLNLYPAKLKDLDIIHDDHDFKTLIQLIEDPDLGYLKEDDELKNLLLDICKQYEPYIYCCYSYSETFWEQLNNWLNIRSTAKIFKSGIQLAADNMPQGEIRPIDYKSVNADRTYIVIHFDNCEIDIGRKSFSKELEDFAQKIAEILVNHYSKYRRFLKKPTGQKPNRKRQEQVDRWKAQCKEYADKNPLNLSIYNIPTICKPAREQEVVALFNQLLGAKVICGIEIMSTDQIFIYDCLYQHQIEPSKEYIYDEISNPLGIPKDEIIRNYECFGFPFYSHTPRVLEYKFSIDGLIEDLKDREKNSNDIDLLVVWETGNKWKTHYHIDSLLDRDNLHLRPYHSVTHIITNPSNNQEEMYLIVLEELINFLKNPEEEEERQKEKYER